jgi:mono/diheme cytochrome c family protein
MRKMPTGAAAFFIAAGAFLASPLVLRNAPHETPASPSGEASPPRAAGAAASAARDVDFTPAYFALDPLAPVSDGAARALFNPADAYGGLPQTEGFDLVAAWCASCHSLRVVMAQSLPPERWDALLDWMVEKQGMAAPAPEDRAAILAYLAAHFAPPG